MIERLATWLFIQKAHAEVIIPSLQPRDGGQGLNPRQGDLASTASSVGGNIIDIMSLFAGAVAVGFIIYYGILYITSGGSPDKAKLARAGITNAFIGIVIITAGYAIIRFAISIGNTISTNVK